MRVTQIIAIGPDARQTVNDGTALASRPLAVHRHNRFADELGHRGPTAPTLGGQRARHVLFQVELRTLHVTMYVIHRQRQQVPARRVDVAEVASSLLA